MASELSVYLPVSGKTVKFIVLSPDLTQAWTTASPPVLVAYNSANLATYAIAGSYNALSKTYFANITAIPSGTNVSILAFDQAGGSLLETDTVAGSAIDVYWNGTRLVSPSDVVSSSGTPVKSSEGQVVSAGPTQVVLPGGDLNATNKLTGWKIEFTSKRRYGIVTDTGTTTTKAIAGGWSDGVTPTAGDSYRWVAPTVLDHAGLDQITVETNMNARQALSPIAAAAAGVVAGAGSGTITIKGAGTTTTRITGTTDIVGNRPVVTLTLPS